MTILLAIMRVLTMAQVTPQSGCPLYMVVQQEQR